MINLLVQHSACLDVLLLHGTLGLNNLGVARKRRL